ncbi:uncharacterized protein L201_006165 [Kwoniella dendrophila CBS 6074]|uniref:Vacuolar protein sorting-associated protein VTA1 n=1 Tax=Kwoniella dendrophila CBS 6074 TaxID=1295534 RepID=A0AAX4K229_9TREE
MENVKIPTEGVPLGLKQCEQILKRANELKKVEPVVAYWCCFSAAQKALAVKQRTKEDTLFLMSVIDALEEMKAILANNEAVTSEAAGAALVEAFALKVFMSADNDDRAGNTGKATIRKFVVAGQFIEVLKCFEGGMTDEMEQKLQYARWKAADGAKALREGRTPVSGPPIPEEENDLNPFPAIPSELPTEPPLPPPKSPPAQGRGSFSSQTRPTMASNSSNTSTPIVSPRPSPQPGNRPPLSGLQTSEEDLRAPIRNHSTGSGAWSTAATPGLPEDDNELHFPTNRPDVILPSAPPLSPPDKGSPGDKKNVRFMGPDGAPLSPASTHITVSSYDAPPPPPPTDFASPPGSPKPSPKVVLQPPPQGRPRGDSSASASSRSGNLPVDGTPKNTTSTSNIPITKPKPTSQPAKPTTNSSVTIPPPPPPSLASYPVHPPSQPQPHGLGLTSPQPQQQNITPALGPTRTNLNRREVETVQKHAKWAVSALEFDDFETARSELRKALNMLGG